MPKKAIIVGASSGIGKALAFELVKQHYVIGITGRRKKELEEIQKVKPEAIHILPSDVTQATATTALDQLLRTLGGLDLFIFSAGVGYLNDKLDYDLENRTNQLNVVAFTKIMSWIIPFFQTQGHGHVVNISSVAKHRGRRLLLPIMPPRPIKPIIWKGYTKKCLLKTIAFTSPIFDRALSILLWHKVTVFFGWLQKKRPQNKFIAPSKRKKLLLTSVNAG